MTRDRILDIVRGKLRRSAREQPVEDYCVAQVEQRGGVCIKLMFLPGWPDRLALLPGAWLAFIELKRPHGGVDEPLQPYIQRKLRKLGFRVYKCKNRQEVDDVFQAYDAAK